MIVELAMIDDASILPVGQTIADGFALDSSLLLNSQFGYEFHFSEELILDNFSDYSENELEAAYRKWCQSLFAVTTGEVVVVHDLDLGVWRDRHTREDWVEQARNEMVQAGLGQATIGAICDSMCNTPTRVDVSGFCSIILILCRAKWSGTVIIATGAVANSWVKDFIDAVSSVECPWHGRIGVRGPMNGLSEMNSTGYDGTRRQRRILETLTEYHADRQDRQLVSDQLFWDALDWIYNPPSCQVWFQHNGKNLGCGNAKHKRCGAHDNGDLHFPDHMKAIQLNLRVDEKDSAKALLQTTGNSMVPSRTPERDIDNSFLDRVISDLNYQCGRHRIWLPMAPGLAFLLAARWFFEKLAENAQKEWTRTLEVMSGEHGYVFLSMEADTADGAWEIYRRATLPTDVVAGGEVVMAYRAATRGKFRGAEGVNRPLAKAFAEGLDGLVAPHVSGRKIGFVWRALGEDLGSYHTAAGR